MKDIIHFIEQSNLIDSVTPKDGTADSLKAWLYLRDQQHLTHEVILNTHKLILQTLNPRIAGRYRDCLVTVGGQTPPAPEMVSGFMREWVDEVNASIPKKNEHPMFPEEIAREMHVDFEHCHPFEDGNGRVGRMLWQWHRLKLGLSVKVIWCCDRDEYYQWFRNSEK